MPRLFPIDRATAPAATQQLLADVDDKLGTTPNLIATLAQSPAAARSYLCMSDELAAGLLAEPLRQQIALTVSQANRCEYCVAGHAAIGISVGLTNDEIRDARLGASPDRKTEAVLRFARRIVEQRGSVSDDDVREMRAAGNGEAEIVEVIANVALIIFSNYFNLVARTEIDFPPPASIEI